MSDALLTFETGVMCKDFCIWVVYASVVVQFLFFCSSSVVLYEHECRLVLETFLKVG